MKYILILFAFMLSSCASEWSLLEDPDVVNEEILTVYNKMVLNEKSQEKIQYYTHEIISNPQVDQKILSEIIQNNKHDLFILERVSRHDNFDANLLDRLLQQLCTTNCGENTKELSTHWLNRMTSGITTRKELLKKLVLSPFFSENSFSMLMDFAERSIPLADESYDEEIVKDVCIDYPELLMMALNRQKFDGDESLRKKICNLLIKDSRLDLLQSLDTKLYVASMLSAVLDSIDLLGLRFTLNGSQYETIRIGSSPGKKLLSLKFNIYGIDTLKKEEFFLESVDRNLRISPLHWVTDQEYSTYFNELNQFELIESDNILLNKSAFIKAIFEIPDTLTDAGTYEIYSNNIKLGNISKLSASSDRLRILGDWKCSHGTIITVNKINGMPAVRSYGETFDGIKSGWKDNLFEATIDSPKDGTRIVWTAEIITDKYLIADIVRYSNKNGPEKFKRHVYYKLKTY